MTIIAPGRICLFGDHQDYLGLPVIACAINRQMILSAEINNDNYFHILMPNINSKRHISISETFNTLEPQDYFASTLRVVKRYGCIPTKGYTINLESN
ncbi:MAG: galactokinase, partial [Flavobacteriaceae bacterium]|nr:galactokinase [Flavobacteriaceae bacterium]